MIGRDDVGAAKAATNGFEVVIGGAVSDMKIRTTKLPSRNGHSEYATFRITDGQESINCIAWPEEYGKILYRIHGTIICCGRVNMNRGEAQLVVADVWSIGEEINLTLLRISEAQSRLEVLRSVATNTTTNQKGD